MNGKKILALSLVLSFVLSGAGCAFLNGGQTSSSDSGNKPNSSDSSSKKPSANVEIEVDEGNIESGELTPAYIFRDNMVLQRDQKVNIYGAGGIRGMDVTVTFNGQTKTVNPERSGTWCVELDPMEANAEGQTLTISDGLYDYSYENVVVGEVWYCSGQSNMAMTLSGLLGQRKLYNVRDYATTPLADYTKYTNWDQIRIYTQAYGQQTDMPNRWGNTTEKNELGWCAPKTMGDAVDHSAYALGFALRLQEVLDVPVGIVVSAVGGSSIEEWLAKETIEEEELALHYTENTKPASGLYNGMSFALNNYTVNGLLWYQGCADSGGISVTHWRADMIAFAKQFRKYHGDVPFISQTLVQYNEGVDWRHIRQVNYDLMNEIDDFYAVNGIASGIPYETYVPDGFTDWIHPVDKYGISKDAAEIALTNTYNKSGYNDVAEYPVAAKKNGEDAFVEFKEGVQLKLSEGTTVNNLEVSTNGIKWVLVDNATVSGNKIIIPGGAQYTKVRYAVYNVMMPGATDPAKWRSATRNSEQMVNLFTTKAGCSDLAVTPFVEIDIA